MVISPYVYACLHGHIAVCVCMYPYVNACLHGQILQGAAVGVSAGSTAKTGVHCTTPTTASDDNTTTSTISVCKGLGELDIANTYDLPLHLLC